MRSGRLQGLSLAALLGALALPARSQAAGMAGKSYNLSCDTGTTANAPLYSITLGTAFKVRCKIIDQATAAGITGLTSAQLLIQQVRDVTTATALTAGTNYTVGTFTAVGAGVYDWLLTVSSGVANGDILEIQMRETGGADVDAQRLSTTVYVKVATAGVAGNAHNLEVQPSTNGDIAAAGGNYAFQLKFFDATGATYNPGTPTWTLSRWRDSGGVTETVTSVTGTWNAGGWYDCSLNGYSALTSGNREYITVQAQVGNYLFLIPIGLAAVATQTNTPLAVPTYTNPGLFGPAGTTTVGDGTNPAGGGLCFNGAATMLDAFTLQASTGTDAVSALTVSLTVGSAAALSLVEITDDTGAVVYGSVANPATDAPSISLTGLSATTTLTQFKVRLTPKSTAPAGSYSVTGTVTALTSPYAKTYGDAGSATVTIDNQAPADVTGLAATPGNTQVALSWTNPAVDFNSVVILRNTVSIADVPVKGTTYTAPGTIGTSAIVYAGPLASYTDTGLTNGQAYYYKVFARDACGSYSAGVQAGPVTPSVTTTVGNGTPTPASGSLCPGATTSDLDAFTLSTSAATDTINSVTVSFAAGTAAGVGTVAITDDAGITTYGQVSNPTDVQAIILTTNIVATMTSTQYHVRIAPKSPAAMPAPPGASYNVTGTVTAIGHTTTNLISYGNTTSATLNLDNLSPGNATWGAVTPGNTQIVLNWTNPADLDFSQVLILRNTASITDTPIEGATYTAGGTIGTSAIRYVGALTSFTDTGLSNGTGYYYKIFAKDLCGNYAAGAQTGPVVPIPNSLTPGTVSATAGSCSLVTVSAAYSGDANVNSSTTFSSSLSVGGPWTAVCSNVVGTSPRSCADATVAATTTYYYQVSFADIDGVNPPNPQVTSVTTPSCSALLTLSSPVQPPAASVSAGSSAAVGKLSASASSGTLTVTSIGVANTGTAAAGTDVLRLQLLDDTTGALLGSSSWNGSLYLFQGLSLSVNAGSPQTWRVVMTAAGGAAAGVTFAMQVSAANVSVQAPNTVGGGPVSGNLFTLAAGPAEGSTNSSAPMVLILNPGKGTTVTGPQFRVQVQVHNPGGLAALTGVTLSTDGGGTFPTALTQNANYSVGTNAAVYEATLSLSPGSYTLVAQAANNVPLTTRSGAVAIAVNPAKKGDGNLLVRDNSSQLCTDCHALSTHSSQTTSTKYGAWAVGCRDCHTPHNTTNIYLVKKSITPPAVNGYQSAKTVNFSTLTGDSGASYTPSTASFANADNSGPCQVCHTRTQNPGTLAARWRNSGNADTHYTAAVGTQACVSCHTHAGGFAAGESGGKTDCTACHNAIFTAMSSTTGTHHHFMYQGWSGISSSSGTTVYPTAVPTSSQIDVNRRCLMCHVDHDIFRPDLNANGGRGKNLRTDITLAPTLTSNFANTDFDSAIASGGICVSCHQTSLTRAYTDPDGTTTTPLISKADFSASSHNYGASNPTSTFAGALTNTFSANCSKCHNDTLAKTKQISAAPNQFSLHDSTLRSMTAPLGVTAPTDPLEETFCYQCHRRSTDVLTGSTAKPAAGMDNYGVRPMSGQSELIYNLFTSATYAFDHPVASTTGVHKVTGEGTAAADGTLSGVNRHVSCADCHNPHGSKSATQTNGAGTATAFATGTAPAFDTLTDSTKAWVADQWKGYSVKIVSGTGAGQTSAIYGNTATAFSGEFATALAAGSKYIILNNGLSTGASGYAASVGPLVGSWGLAPTWPAPPAPPVWNDSAGAPASPVAITTQFAPIVTWNRVETPAHQGQVCIKCHSAYAYGVTPPNAPSGIGTSTSAAWSNTLGAAIAQSDKANEFNPNNLGHHAVFARGKNQPLVSSDVTTSTYNPSWPKYTTGTVTATLGSATVTLAGGAWPTTTVPGWFIFIGSIAPAQAVAGWYEVSAVLTTTTLTLDRAYTGATGAGKAFMLSAGLGNNFVPPWGPWSQLECSDCHTSDATTDPYGPHGSATKWLLTKVPAATQTFAFYNGTAVAQVTNTITDLNLFCLNCHRRDVYGDYNFYPIVTAAPGTYARQGHPPDSGDQSSLGKKNKWGLACMNCHGGARIGGIHGENLGKGGGGATAGSYSGKRLLGGSTWYAVTRSTTAAAGACWTKGAADSVDNCAHTHNGTAMESGVAKYDYDTNP